MLWCKPVPTVQFQMLILLAAAFLGGHKEEICTMGRSGFFDIDVSVNNAINERDVTGRVQRELTFTRKVGSRFFGEASSKRFKSVDGPSVNPKRNSRKPFMADRL